MKRLLYSIFVIVVVLTSASCHKDNYDIDVSNVIDIQENAIEILNNQSALGQSEETILNNCKQQLLLNPDVSSAFVQGPDQIVIKYKSGVTGVILITDEDEEQKSVNPKHFNNIPQTKGGEVQISSNKVLIWEPFNGGAFDVANVLSNAFTSCSDIDFDVDVISGENCTFQSLNNLTQYGFVYIHTHGGVDMNSQWENVSWILTRELVSPSEKINQDLTEERKIIVTVASVKKEYVNNLEIRRFRSKSSWWAITDRYISKYITGTFSSPSVVFIQACHSFDNGSLRDVFINDKKASAYLGYENSVYTYFGRAKAIEFVTYMLQHRLNAEDAYDNITTKVDNTVSLSSWWDWWIEENPRARLNGYFKDKPTYYGQMNYVECSDLNKRWTLDSSLFYDQGWYSTFNMSGDSVDINFNLTLMDNMLEGSYSPYIINHSNVNTDFFDNGFNIPMKFIVETSSDGSWLACGSYFFIGDNDYDITDGQLTYHILNNNQKRYTFDFTDNNGYSYHGEYTE